MVIMFRTGWMTRPAENAARAVSIAGIRRSHASTARTSASSSCITMEASSCGGGPRLARFAWSEPSGAEPLDAARLEPAPELPERGRLDLAHALPRHAQSLADRLE